MIQRASLYGLLAAGLLAAVTLAGCIDSGRPVTTDAAVGPAQPVVATATLKGKITPGNTVTITSDIETLGHVSPVRITLTQESGVPVAIAQPEPGFHLVARGVNRRIFEAPPAQIILPWSWSSAAWTSGRPNRIVLRMNVETGVGTYTRQVEIDLPSGRTA